MNSIAITPELLNKLQGLVASTDLKTGEFNSIVLTLDFPLTHDGLISRNDLWNDLSLMEDERIENLKQGKSK